MGAGGTDVAGVTCMGWGCWGLSMHTEMYLDAAVLISTYSCCVTGFACGKGGTQTAALHSPVVLWPRCVVLVSTKHVIHVFLRF
jgi:hypothetical protein